MPGQYRYSIDQLPYALEELVKAAWPRLTFTAKVNKEELQKFCDYAYKCGFLKRKIDLKNIYAER